MKIKSVKYKSFYILVMALLVLLPMETADACFSVKPKDTNINIVLPIDEIEDLIEQLEDAGSSIVGDAGIQMRQTIDELSEQLGLRIDQLKSAGSELIAEASAELKSIINDLVKQANLLLSEVNKMIQDNIKCIDEVLAARISQITDSVYGILDKVDVTLKNAIDRIYVRATMIVDTGAQRAALVIDNTLKMVAKIGIFILTFILLFWLIKMLWKSSFPKSKALAIGIPVFVVLLVGAGVFLLVSKSALPRLIGQEIPIPNWQTSCDDGDTDYNNFIEMKNSGATKEELKTVGKKALEELNWCLYASISPEVSRETNQKINAISAIIFPPVAPPPSSGGVSGSPCGGNNGGVSIHPGWLSGYTIDKIKIRNTLIDKRILKKEVKVNPNIYKNNLRFINPAIRINEVSRVVKTFQPAELEKIDPAVINALKIRNR